MTAPAWGTHPNPDDPHPDCLHEWHGADAGTCPGCGWDSHHVTDRDADPMPLMPWDTLDDCGRCVLVAALGGPVRATQADCPVHGLNPSDRQT